jgi:hypothetical protein
MAALRSSTTLSTPSTRRRHDDRQSGLSEGMIQLSLTLAFQLRNGVPVIRLRRMTKAGRRVKVGELTLHLSANATGFCIPQLSRGLQRKGARPVVSRNFERIDQARSEIREERTLLADREQELGEDEFKSVLIVRLAQTIILLTSGGFAAIALYDIVRYAHGWYALAVWVVATAIGCLAGWKAPAEEMKCGSHFWSIVSGVVTLLFVFFASAFLD